MKGIFYNCKLFYFQDLAELGCLRAIILFNPDARYLDPAVSSQVESLREKVYATLERYCRQHNENEVSRFAKLLLRLPALRSIGLKCVEQLFFYKLIKVYYCQQIAIIDCVILTLQESV